MENLIELSEGQNLESIVAEGKTTIIDFWAPWCGPCKTLGPVLETIAAEKPEINVVKVNVDEHSDLSVTYGIRSVPAVFIYKNGEQTGKFVGMKQKDDILGLL